jgi:hypothetical protein
VPGFIGAQARDAASCKAAVREAHRAEREKEKARASILKRDAAAKALDDKVGGASCGVRVRGCATLRCELVRYDELLYELSRRTSRHDTSSVL